jgi:hypothetical protein
MTVTENPPTAAPARPSYLGLLNAIAVAELRGSQNLTAWADVCTDPDVEQAIRKVAVREGEHSFTFARRVVELGYRVRHRENTEDEDRRFKISGATDMTDLEKFVALGYENDPDLDLEYMNAYFTDTTIDPVTGALLGRFICEERDSVRVLRQAYLDTRARQGA